MIHISLLVAHGYSYYLPFFQLSWRLWLRDLSNPIVTFSNPNLDLGFSFLFRIAFRITRLGMFRSLRQCPDHLGHLDTVLNHLGPLNTTLGPSRFSQAHLGYLDPFGHLRPLKTHQAHLAHLGPLRPTQANLGTLGLGTLGLLDIQCFLHDSNSRMTCMARMAFTVCIVCVCLVFIYLFT